MFGCFLAFCAGALVFMPLAAFVGFLVGSRYSSLLDDQSNERFSIAVQLVALLRKPNADDDFGLGERDEFR
jgi:hypothetical protein